MWIIINLLPWAYKHLPTPFQWMLHLSSTRGRSELMRYILSRSLTHTILSVTRISISAIGSVSRGMPQESQGQHRHGQGEIGWNGSFSNQLSRTMFTPLPQHWNTRSTLSKMAQKSSISGKESRIKNSIIRFESLLLSLLLPLSNFSKLGWTLALAW